ncbi:DNA mismatch repair protein MutL [Devosia geojensis]|uniref:DNA mismatch repair protein MutL n=1 Tax=Devosia geojensis TaxID=443610 RepID=A0A0F5FT95_9HYPH|nr:DNA mismatch repair endonuclease MutL [Devosia geojensis]KKB12081.1 DNA mismatch repair protein MutL [Devosia geojensis]
MAIRQLPETLINRIAAGEVVERPASVVKELVENAIDAGAGRIVVTTAGGGKDLIRIEDDGAGMDEADLRLSVERHATSKLSADDLDDIRTLGFRGEALASIGSVAELTISTRQAGAANGLRLAVRNGVKSHPVPAAMNRGTTVEVKNLFANVPARLKFLKSDRAEAGAVTDVVKRLAMANPGVHFVLTGSDRAESNWPAVTGEGALGARLAQVVGADFAENAVQLATVRHGIVVAGLAGLPTYTRANSLSQFYFVNGRSVRDKVLVGAVRAAYADYTFRDRFPVVALYISIDPAEVDVNVHPAKAELRFRDAGAVRGAVIRAIGEALAAAGFKASTTVGEDILAAFQAPAAPMSARAYSDAAEPMPYASGSASYSTPSPAPAWSAAPARSPAPSWEAGLAGLTEPSGRIEALEEGEPGTIDFPLGTARAQMFENFIIAQNGDGLLLVDQHAAHERLVYERFKAQMAAGPVPSQRHLIPAVVELPEEDCARLEEAAPTLERLGLYLERFGARAIAVRETPALLGQADIDGLVKDLADGLAEWETTTALSDRLEAIIARMACHGSVRSGRRLKVEEMNALLREMEATPHSGQCIHGRPTYVELKKRDIERLFGRSR